MLKVVGIFVAALFIGQSQGESICDQRPDDACPPDAIIAMLTGPLLPTAEFLDKFCPKMLQSVQCIISYNDTCEDSRGETVDPLTYGNIYDSLSEVCDEKGEIGRGYRENVDCINGLFPEISMLVVKGGRDVEDFIRSKQLGLAYGSRPSSEIICVGIAYVAGLLESAIELGCGEDAGRTVDLMLESFLDECPVEEKMRPYVEQFTRFISEKEAASDEKEVVEEVGEAVEEEVGEAVEEEVFNPNIVKRSPLFPLPY